MHQSFLVLEVMIELALARSGSFNDLVRTGQVHALLVEKIRRRPDNLQLSLQPGGTMSLHKPLSFCTDRYNQGLPPQPNHLINAALVCTSIRRTICLINQGFYNRPGLLWQRQIPPYATQPESRGLPLGMLFADRRKARFWIFKIGLGTERSSRLHTRKTPVSNADKTILVTGTTGRQGGSVINHMLAKGWRLRALTRYPANAVAQQLANRGIEVVQGDLEDPASLEHAARGAYGVYSVQDFWAVGARREVQQGKNLAEAAKKAGVAHFVYSSVGGVERNSHISHC